MEKEEEEVEEIFAGVLEESVSAGILEDLSLPLHLEYPAEEISQLFNQINELPDRQSVKEVSTSLMS